MFTHFAVINKQGKDIEGLARALPSKSVPQCRNFFTNYKRKLNLPRLIAEYEIKHVSMKYYSKKIIYLFFLNATGTKAVAIQ